MLKLLQNTLNIIGNVSLSMAGYLLKIQKHSSEIIAFTGENRSEYLPLNEELLHLYWNDTITTEKVTALDSYKHLNESLSVASVYCKPILIPANEDYAVYLFLFSSKKTNYNDKNFKAAQSIINTLADQLSGNIPDIKTPFGSTESSEITIKEGFTINSEELLSSIFELSEDIILIVDSNGLVVKINNNGAMLLDYNHSELIGRHFLDFADYRGKAIIAQALKNILKLKNTQKIECSLITKTGKEIKIDANGKAIITDGKVTGMFCVAKDVTKLKIYENASKDLNVKLLESHRLLSIERGRSDQRKAVLEELNELKSEFISNISHELRTPLASIIGFSETIASDPEMPAEMKAEFIQIIIQEGKRLAKLINDILDLSRVESGKTDFSMTDIGIISVLSDVIEVYKKQITAKAIVLTCDFPDEEIIINADKERIAKVFYELIGNAVKYTKDGGRINIIAQNLYRELEIIISDTGMGIQEKDIPYIFQKFYRAGRPGAESPGTGLGLVFVKQIVELHKGLVLVQSEINKGSSFIVKLPKSLKVQKNKV
jgi:PAS domain S-box-containing protein